MESADMMLKKLGFTVSNLIDGQVNSRDQPVSLSFIYGIGTGGLSQFEQAISSMSTGESIEVGVEVGQMRSYFGPLYRRLCSSADLSEFPGPLTLKFTLVSCESAEPKEIVTAMAEGVNEGGCSSDCGCGCGGH